MKSTIQLTGKVRAFLMNPKGQTDGLLLEDGKQLHLSPRWSNHFNEIVLLGNEIEVIAEPGIASALGQEFKVLQLTHTQSGQTLNLEGSVPEIEVPEQPLEIKGTVETGLVGHKGELKGLLLTDGAQLHLPKPLRKQVAAAVNPGDAIAATGTGVCSESGTCIEVSTLTINGNPLLQSHPLIEHHERAAHHHLEAAKHHRAGDDKEAMHHANQAAEHLQKTLKHQQTAALADKIVV